MLKGRCGPVTAQRLQAKTTVDEASCIVATWENAHCPVQQLQHGGTSGENMLLGSGS